MKNDATELDELRIIWAALVAAIPVVPIAVVLATEARPAPVPPEWVNWLLWIGVLSSLAAWPAIARFRRAVEKTPRTRADLVRLRQSMVMGMGVADLPMVLGVLHYLLAADVRVLTGLSLLSLLVAFAFRPPAN